MNVHRLRLGRLVRQRVGARPAAVVCLGDIAPHVPGRTDGAIALAAPPLSGPPRADAALVVYADVARLADWKSLTQDVDAALSGCPHVVIALIRPGYRSLPVAGSGHLLSQLISAFPRRRFDLGIDAYVPPLARLRARLARAVRGDFRASVSPTRFAALVVSIRRREARPQPASLRGADVGV